MASWWVLEWLAMDMAYTEINLDAIASNTRVLCDAARERGAQLMAVVKADGYNHGAVDVARVMVDNGADQLGVATLAEAHALRDAGIDVPVLCWIWSPEQDVEAAVSRGITLGVPSVRHARRAVEAADVVGGEVPVTVKVDTGLNRSGVDESEWVECFGLLAAAPSVRVTGVFSHFSCADGGDDAAVAATDAQIAVFERAIGCARECGLEVPVNHIANSPAVLSRPDAYFDMVRPGVALYGIDPLEEPTELSARLRPAMSWAGRVTVVKPIARGEGTSYGLTWVAPEDGFTAVVPIGYADGLVRAAQGALEVTIAGRRYPQVGRVCMDQIVVWLGDNAHGVAPGDEAVVFGSGDRGEMTADQLARGVGTIAYELVCSPKGRTVRHVLRSRRCESMADTQALGREIGAQLVAGDVIILDGPLGAGKTTFTQGVAQGLQVKGRVTSPTFVIAREHRSLVGGPSLVHVDAYRLFGEDPEGHSDASADPWGALDALDLDSELDEAVVVAEWGGGLVEALSDSYVLVSFDRESAVVADPESEARLITWRRVGRG